MSHSMMPGRRRLRRRAHEAGVVAVYEEADVIPRAQRHGALQRRHRVLGAEEHAVARLGDARQHGAVQRRPAHPRLVGDQPGELEQLERRERRRLGEHAVEPALERRCARRHRLLGARVARQPENLGRQRQSRRLDARQRALQGLKLAEARPHVPFQTVATEVNAVLGEALAAEDDVARGRDRAGEGGGAASGGALGSPAIGRPSGSPCPVQTVRSRRRLPRLHGRASELHARSLGEVPRVP